MKLEFTNNGVGVSNYDPQTFKIASGFCEFMRAQHPKVFESVVASGGHYIGPFYNICVDHYPKYIALWRLTR